LTLELHREIQRLAPFGNGNPAPRWGVRGVTAKEIRPLGASGDHLLCMFERDGHPLPRGVWFRNGEALEALRSASAPLDVVFELRENNYGGESSVELQIVDAGNSEFRI
jgi:single-stranded-DNA-specific exonuclease